MGDNRRDRPLEKVPPKKKGGSRRREKRVLIKEMGAEKDRPAARSAKRRLGKTKKGEEG